MPVNTLAWHGTQSNRNERKTTMTESLKSQLRNVGFDVTGEIRDAVSSLGIFINPKDIQRGQSGNPMQCTTAQCLRRAIDSKHARVAVFLSTAYVQIPGVSHVRRYQVPTNRRRDVIIPQDEGTEIMPGDYILRAPSASFRLGQAAERRERLRKLREEGKKPPMSRRIGPTKRNIRIRWQRTT